MPTPPFPVPFRSLPLPSPSKRRSGAKIGKVGFIVLHDTGNPGSTAAQNVAYYTRTAHETSASAHLFVDDREIVECVPTGLSGGSAEKAWHVRYDMPGDNELYGDDANDVAIGVELCFGGGINNPLAVTNYVAVLAELVKLHRLDPVKDLCTHQFLDPRRRTDPANGLRASNTTVDQVREWVRLRVGSGANLPGSAAAYRVRFELNIRDMPSHVNGKILGKYKSGESVSGLIVVGTTVQGENRWLQIQGGGYCWLGGLQ